MENNHQEKEPVEDNNLDAQCNAGNLSDNDTIETNSHDDLISPLIKNPIKLLKQRSKSEDHLADLTCKNSKGAKNIFVNSGKDEESFNIDAKVQFSGYLYKQPFGSKGKSKKWQRRFFVIKEGFLLYYPESEGRDFEKNHIFNIHPKGVIPLGGCEVEKLQIQGHRYSLSISHSSFVGGSVIVAVISESSQNEWYQAIKDCSKVTWKNSALGAEVIKELEENTKQLIEDKKKFIEKLETESQNVAGEKEKMLELEELSNKLKEEKAQLEEATLHVQEEKDLTNTELEFTLKQLSELTQEKAKLESDTTKLNSLLTQVKQEKEESVQQLHEKDVLSKTLQEEKTQLELKAEQLVNELSTVTAESEAIAQAKLAAEEELKSQIEAAARLQNEAEGYRKHYQDLENHINSISSEKLEAETKYLVEHKSRAKTEKKLRQAEAAVKRLDRALKERGINIDIDLDTDIKGLIGFFEEVIEEETFEKNKLEIMKSAISARAQFDHLQRETSIDTL